MASNHDGVKKATEEEAALLFELPELRQAAAAAAACFQEGQLLSAQAEECHRETGRKRLEMDAMRRANAAKTQAEGGRLAHIEANRLATEATELAIQAATRLNDSEKRTVEGERIWAELAHRHGAYIPHGRRIEVKAAEVPGHVYCYDVDEGEMSIHPENLCPTCTPRHDKGSRMLRRRGAGGRLALWPGRKE